MSARGHTVQRGALAPVALVLVVSTVFVLVTLGHREWDVSSFILAGDHFSDKDLTPSPITVLPGSVGYDGQMYYRLALDPFTDQQTAFGVTLDHPAFRVQRIGYPLIVWLFSLGHKALVPTMLVVVNLLGLGAIAYLGCRIAGALDCPAWTGLMLVYPGFLVTLTRDTTEITATAFALAAILCVLRGREWLGVLLACCAVLCRETTLLYMSGFGLIALWRCWRERRLLSPDWLKFTVPLLVFLAWQQFLTAKWGVTPETGGEQNLEWPLLGPLEIVREMLTAHRYFFPKLWLDWVGRFILLGIAAVMLSMILEVARVARSSRVPSGLKVTWALYACLFLCMGMKIWGSPLDSMRAFTECYTAGSIVLLGARFVRSAEETAVLGGSLLTRQAA